MYKSLRQAQTRDHRFFFLNLFKGHKEYQATKFCCAPNVLEEILLEIDNPAWLLETYRPSFFLFPEEGMNYEVGWSETFCSEAVAMSNAKPMWVLCAIKRNQ